MPKNTAKPATNGSALGFEATLWAAADKLRGNVDAAEYKNVVLGLIFLKYISESFAEKHAALQKEKGADPEERDEYTADNIFWVPPEARWPYLQGRAKDPSIGKLLDNAMVAIERDNPAVKGVLPKDYARPHLDKHRLGELIDARKLGTLIDRVHRELTDEDIPRITATYHAWRADRPSTLGSRPSTYSDIPGFCKSATLEEIRAHGHVLTPGRYVGAEEAEDDDEPFEQKMKRLTATLEEQFGESAKLEKAITANLRGLGYVP
jgi:type I restriction-modification system DNA methylase subunit